MSTTRRASSVRGSTTPKRPRRALLAENATQDSATGDAPRRAPMACRVCRARKVKCSNERPTCAGCVRLGCECVYPVPTVPYETQSNNQSSDGIASTLQEILRRLPPTAETCQNHASNQSSVGTSAAFTTLDYMFQWPIFCSSLGECSAETNILATNHFHEPDQLASSGLGLPLFDSGEVAQLLTRFLRLVHVMNPILDCTTLMHHGRVVAELGLQWDAKTCLVLLAMALGSIAKPLETRLEPLESASRSVSGDDEKSRQQAELYYQYALRRIGMIGGSLTACQCHFLNGIYLLYTLRPVQAWQAFFHASSLYTVYLKSRAAALQIGPGHYHDDALIGDESCSGEKLRCCLEQRLYWSCIKSESEICTEVDLPRSELGKMEYPYLFPSPPTPKSVDGLHDTHDMGAVGMLAPTALLSVDDAAEKQDFKTLHEHSWFSYLSNIALLRISSRVDDEFYTKPPSLWASMNLLDMANTAWDLEKQLLQWQHTLPSSISCFDETASLPTVTELQLATWLHCTSVRLRMYRPFLYRLALQQGHDWPLADSLKQFADKAVVLSLNPLHTLGLQHRHAGSWFRCRESASRVLILICARKIGLVSKMGLEQQVQDMLGICLAHLRFWEEEAEDIRRVRQVLEPMS
ncbi:Zn(2)-C6 fungal-type DNA-binding domain protein, partial [Metarhizium hybridum]